MNTILFQRILLCALLLCTAVTAHAGMLMDVVTGVSLVRGSFTNLGYEVTFHQPVSVRALGLFDLGANGLTDPHLVGLWDLNGNLLASATVDNSSRVVNGVRPTDAWRFTDIDPLVVAAGTYVLGAFYPTVADGFLGSLGGTFATYTVNPLASIGSHRFLNAVESFGFPGGTASADLTPGFFGPNAIVEPVPEPGTLGMLGAAMLLVWLGRRRLSATGC